MNKTTILGAVVIVGSLAKAAADYLQGHPIDFQLLSEGVTAGLGFIFMRAAIQKTIDK